MASERDEAKQSASEPQSSDPDLGQTLETASNFSIDLIKEKNRHLEQMAQGERGGLGWLVGGPSSAPTIIAFLVASAGLLVAVWCLNQASDPGANAEFWAKQAERGFALAGTAIGFIFGRSVK